MVCSESAVGIEMAVVENWRVSLAMYRRALLIRYLERHFGRLGHADTYNPMKREGVSRI
jgi:hypothetical protein